LKESFFKTLDKLNNRFKSTKEDRIAMILIESFQCKFLARDFENLCNRINIFNTLSRGDGSADSIVHKSQLSSQGGNEKLKEKLRTTFIDIFFSIVARITDAKEIKSVELKRGGFTSIPKLARTTTVIDANYGELIVSKAINELFRIFS
jgi:hypothetical protein